MAELLTMITLGAILFYPVAKNDKNSKGNQSPIIKIGM